MPRRAALEAFSAPPWADVREIFTHAEMNRTPRQHAPIAASERNDVQGSLVSKPGPLCIEPPILVYIVH